VTAGTLHGTAFRYTGCEGDKAVDVVALTEPTRLGEVVWVRVRYSATSDIDLEAVLSGLTVSAT
jgi:hypothetical protein